MTSTIQSQLFFSLDSIQPCELSEAGSLINVTGSKVPGLVNISFSELKLNPGGALQPMWHPNAHKVGYCVEGKVNVSLRTPDAPHLFCVERGEMFFIPQGYVHHIENCGSGPCCINFACSHTEPHYMVFGKSVASIGQGVFKATFNAQTVAQHPQAQLLIKTKVSSPASKNSRYLFNIEKSAKPVQTKGGYLQVGTKKSLSTLEGLGILGFGLTSGGCVEPHWHTNAGELVYITKGRTRITVLAPGGQPEFLEVRAGQGAFAPASYFHNIENIGNDQVEVIAFFSHAEPDYIGVGEVWGTYSNELLASIFNISTQEAGAIKKPEGPLVIVPI